MSEEITTDQLLNLTPEQILIAVGGQLGVAELDWLSRQPWLTPHQTPIILWEQIGNFTAWRLREAVNTIDLRDFER
ncbi:hypothetical protein A3A66_00255 [Microgenomates group bacterium RIFCSPLOWO2_01_FULL_46_13]|nr:MAG: hypothetical protein A3A66_00255 [Microgenomates group bacterium RIFCSPLOWO2_01_FULL_46_13]